MSLSAYFGSLSVANLLSRMPAAAAQGMIWGLMALGVFITFRVLDIADLTVDGSFATGGAVQDEKMNDSVFQMETIHSFDGRLRVDLL